MPLLPTEKTAFLAHDCLASVTPLFHDMIDEAEGAGVDRPIALSIILALADRHGRDDASSHVSFTALIDHCGALGFSPEDTKAALAYLAASERQSLTLT